MKVLVLIGSARKGNTYKLTQLVCDRMKQLGEVEFEEIFLNNIDLNYCISCHSCIIKGEQYCPDRHVVDNFEEKMLNADAIIIATPVYMLNVPASVKNFIDHYSYLLHRPKLFNKNVLVIVNTAGGGDKKVTNYLKSVFEYWGVNKVFTFRYKVFALQLEVTDKLNKKLDNISNKFYSAIKSEKVYGPSLKRVAFFNLWRAINSLDKTGETADYKYWKKEGWLDKVYPIDSIKNPFKNLVGKFIYFFMKRNAPKNK
ncbi:flavodoxin family protein [Abyssisolibacter fermentans]|uniref:flavodoxin family protein n=1 Tax=Abyssisolibacter fermentans TaxID=1766203 RepID=UPI00082B038B|nr:flavodoxin family protein [Abyssisolibacter fermentans]